MANLSFDPLFDPSLPEEEKKEREAPRISDNHDSNPFAKKTQGEQKARNNILYYTNKVITVLGSLLCVGCVAFVFYYCIIYMGIL